MIFIVMGVGVSLLLCFSLVLLVGAPYLPTLTPQVRAAIILADLKPGQRLLELGCGDGKVVIAAAKMGIEVVGYELNPILAITAWLRTLRYRHLVTIYCQNFWSAEWAPADAIFVFLLPRYMSQLDRKVGKYQSKRIKLVSFAFKIPDKKISRELDGVFLYEY